VSSVRSSTSAWFYAVVRIVAGALVLGTASRFLYKALVHQDFGADAGHFAAIGLWSVLALPVILGWHARLAAGLLAAFGIVLISSGSFFYNNHMYLLCLTLFLVSLSDCERHYALRPRGSGPIDRWPRNLMQFQLTVVYLFAGLQKINPRFLSGDALDYYLERAVGPFAPLGNLLAGTSVVVPLAFTVIALEISLALAVRLPRLRQAAFGAALPLHVGMLLVAYNDLELFGIVLFAILTFVLLSSYVDLPEQGRLVVWDDSCGFCRRWIDAVRRFDAFHALRFVGSSAPAAYDATGVTAAAAAAAVQLVEPDGTVRAGIAAVQGIVSVLPGGFLVAPYLSLPVVRQVGDRVYRRVAARRTCNYETMPARAA
jgi:predicted DCC family thiol-disulfide oxidoreductase YuxK